MADSSPLDGSPRALQLVAVWFSQAEEAVSSEFERLWRQPREEVQAAVIALGAVAAQLTLDLADELEVEPLELLARLQSEGDVHDAG